MKKMKRFKERQNQLKIDGESKSPLVSIFKFSIVAGLAFLLFTSIAYYFYGWDYLEQGLLYHFTRKDHRHNYSPYFHLFYTESVELLPPFSALLAFIPQILIMIFAGLKLGSRNLSFACFLITFVFVTFNKVITSQVLLLTNDSHHFIVLCLVSHALSHGLSVTS